MKAKIIRLSAAAAVLFTGACGDIDGAGVATEFLNGVFMGATALSGVSTPPRTSSYQQSSRPSGTYYRSNVACPYASRPGAPAACQ